MPYQPSPPSESRIAINGGNAATTMNETRRKNKIAIRQPARTPAILWNQPIALDGIADFESCMTSTRKRCVKTCVAKVIGHYLANFANGPCSILCYRRLQDRREHVSANVPSSDRSLPDHFVFAHSGDELVVIGALGQIGWKQRLRNLAVLGRLARREQ